MTGQRPRYVLSGFLGGLLGALIGAALPFLYHLVVEGGHGGPGAIGIMMTMSYVAIGAGVGAVVGILLGVGFAWARKKPDRQTPESSAGPAPPPASDERR